MIMKKILAVLCIGFFCVSAINSYFNKTQAAIAHGVIRLHVLANSNSSEDQALKLKVRDRIISEMKSSFSLDGDIILAREVIMNNKEKIRSIAKDEVEKNGFSYDVNISLGQSDFPTKNYGEIVLPAGKYEALKIEIGKAQGQNWWCVLFPPLCFVDESCVSYSSEGAKMVAKNVGEENAELIRKEKTPKVKLKFKSYELWQNGKRRLAYLFGMK